MNQTEKGKTFRALHERSTAFIIPNPWDIGSARILAHLGFEALATTSAGYAFSVGQKDNEVSHDETLTHLAQLASATNLPVSADLGKGFGDSPEAVAETITLTAATGIVGGSIEDMTMQADRQLYEIQFAAERIRAAVEAARALPFTFTLTARAENYLVGEPDLKDTIKRLQAYEEAGADVLYAPGLTKKDEIVSVVTSVSRPVNVLMGMSGVGLSLSELSEMGVKRVSLGAALSRVALGALIRAAREMLTEGTFTWVDDAVNSRELVPMLYT